jgi:uncharacterized membrane protein YqgA involved in biofilm formation
VFVIGPLAVLGALSDGLGRGIEQLALKAVPVGDMLPALVVAPLLTLLVQAVR